MIFGRDFHKDLHQIEESLSTLSLERSIWKYEKQYRSPKEKEESVIIDKTNDDFYNLICSKPRESVNAKSEPSIWDDTFLFKNDFCEESSALICVANDKSLETVENALVMAKNDLDSSRMVETRLDLEDKTKSQQKISLSSFLLSTIAIVAITITVTFQVTCRVYIENNTINSVETQNVYILENQINPISDVSTCIYSKDLSCCSQLAKTSIFAWEKFPRNFRTKEERRSFEIAFKYAQNLEKET